MAAIKRREDLEKVEELASSINQVEEVRLQDKLGEQNFQENVKKWYKNHLLIETKISLVKLQKQLQKPILITTKQ